MQTDPQAWVPLAGGRHGGLSSPALGVSEVNLCPRDCPCPKYPLGCQGESRGRRLPRCPGSLPSKPAGKVGLCPILLPRSMPQDRHLR